LLVDQNGGSARQKHLMSCTPFNWHRTAALVFRVAKVLVAGTRRHPNAIVDAHTCLLMGEFWVRRRSMNAATSAGSNLSFAPMRIAVSDPFFTHWYNVFSWQRRTVQTSLTVNSSSLSNSRS